MIKPIIMTTSGTSKYGYEHLTKGKYEKNNIKVNDPYASGDTENGTTILHLCAHRNLCQVRTIMFH